MTKEDIICMAQEAGFELDCCSLEWHNRIERFAAFVAAHEREVCAKVCDELERANLYGFKECAAAIRSRT
jgi:hypothetical protein